jgi:hypothetical protein
VVLALALVHHLAIGENVPLGKIADFLGGCGRHLLVEFVPKEDPQVAGMLALRRDIFPDYCRDGFERAFGRHFRILEREELRASGRILYAMEARARQ